VPDQIQAELLKRWAMECADEAQKPRHNEEQRARLLKMREALLDLATTHDWLDGHPATQNLQRTEYSASRDGQRKL
jgi:hypothetical protein